MKKILLVLVALLSTRSFAQTPDWSTHVAPILYNRCTGCHHSGGIAPFALMSYSDAVSNGPSIKFDVENKIMPPWPPDPSYSHMAHERVLSTAEINTIANWVNGGMPQGDPSLAPPLPIYGNHGYISATPDLVTKIPAYTSTAATGDVYQCFVIPSGLVTDRYIKAVEAIPGNAAAVHHVLIYADTSGICAHLDSLTPEPGYPNFSGVGSNSATLLGVWVPGSAPVSYPSGFGGRIPANADIVLQIHYPAGSAGILDSTEIHFYFTPATTSVRPVSIEPVLYHKAPVIDTDLFIPANTTRTFFEHVPGVLEAYYVGDATLLGIMPHMHLLGQSIKSFAVHPAGDTDQLIRINKWDFHWQGFYMFPKLKKVPSFSDLWAEAFYDNTSGNPDNPNSPPQDVSVGENTTDEMMVVFMAYTKYKSGDENISADSSYDSHLALPLNNYYHGQQLLAVNPNPVVNNIIVKYFLDEPDVCSIALMDMQGKLVHALMPETKSTDGYSAHSWSVAGIPDGTYTLLLRTTRRILSQKIVISH